jgi:hypothetical protein
MLGTTVPEPNHDGRVFVCSAGVSAELGSLLRIYPLARACVPRRWGRFRVPVERNPSDRRRESFKIHGDRTPENHPTINRSFEPLGELSPSRRAALLAPYVVPSIREANDKRLSLALIRPQGGRLEVHFREREQPDVLPTPQLGLFDDHPPSPSGGPLMLGSKRFPLAPYLRFADEAGPHDLQIRDWGTYELMRKHLADPDYYRANLAQALHLGPTSTLLVGNMSHQRNVWLIISILNGLIGPPQLGFDLLV